MQKPAKFRFVSVRPSLFTIYEEDTDDNQVQAALPESEFDCTEVVECYLKFHSARLSAEQIHHRSYCQIRTATPEFVAMRRDINSAENPFWYDMLWFVGVIFMYFFTKYISKKYKASQNSEL